MTQPDQYDPSRKTLGMNILVTGGAGFIGSHLCERLLSDGHQVMCFDNFSTGSMENIPFLTENFIVIGDVITGKGFSLPFQFGGKIDRIYNLASPASPVAYQSDPDRTLRTNVVGSANLLELARKFRARIMQASTSEVYGDPEIHPQPETYWGNVNPIGPRACYDEGKRAAETLFMDYHRRLGIDIRIARIFNTYGPRMAENDGRVISNFVSQYRRGEPLTIYGGGFQTRSFCYVDDMVEGLIRLMEYDGSHCHEPFNLGNPDERTILDVAKMFNAERAYKPMPEDDPRRRCPDISKARTLLCWTPTVSLEDGLKRTIEAANV